jgi:DNA topoisomerase-1
MQLERTSSSWEGALAGTSFVLTGKLPALTRGEARASVPEGLAPDEITVDKALELLAAAGQAEVPIGQTPDGVPVFLRTGRFGSYVQLGEIVEDGPKPKRMSLPKGVTPDQVVNVPGDDGFDGHTVYLWTTPLKKEPAAAQ